MQHVFDSSIFKDFKNHQKSSRILDLISYLHFKLNEKCIHSLKSCINSAPGKVRDTDRKESETCEYLHQYNSSCKHLPSQECREKMSALSSKVRNVLTLNKAVNYSTLERKNRRIALFMTLFNVSFIMNLF